MEFYRNLRRAGGTLGRKNLPTKQQFGPGEKLSLQSTSRFTNKICFKVNAI